MSKVLNVLIAATLLLALCPTLHAALESRTYNTGITYLTFEADDAIILPKPTAVKTGVGGQFKNACAFTSYALNMEPTKASPTNAVFSDLVVEKKADGNVNRFFLACVSNKMYTTLKLSTYDLNNKPVSEITLKNVLVSSVDFAGAGDEATARITFKFEQAVFDTTNPASKVQIP